VDAHLAGCFLQSSVVLLEGFEDQAPFKFIEVSFPSRRVLYIRWIFDWWAGEQSGLV
jgi:hypothetical protein